MAAFKDPEIKEFSATVKISKEDWEDHGDSMASVICNVMENYFKSKDVGIEPVFTAELVGDPIAAFTVRGRMWKDFKVTVEQSKETWSKQIGGHKFERLMNGLIESVMKEHYMKEHYVETEFNIKLVGARLQSLRACMDAETDEDLKELVYQGWWRDEERLWHCPNEACKEVYNDKTAMIAFDWPLNKPGFCGSCVDKDKTAENDSEDESD